MKATYLSSARSLRNFQFWLLGIAAGLIAIHLTLIYKTDKINLLGNSILFWLATSFLVWNKRDRLKLNSGIFASCLGAAILALVLLKSTSLPDGYFLLLSPLISALGLALLASDFKGLKQYWQELTSLFFLGGPQVLLSSLVDPSLLTAKFATFTLWYSGFEVSRAGLNIELPTGYVEVYPGCSGIESITQLLSLSALFLIMFPVRGIKKIFVPIVAVLVAFVVNGIRVAIMAVLVASSRQEAFNYWHTGDGSVLFSMIAVLLFGLFCLLLLQQAKPENQESMES
ncbi:MAG TPA: cyanoexosortase A [Coleofasciculaceae cyanobacterium]|jgi:cyanoexosortase A